jgi:signal transduction histidine kinase
MADRRRFEQVLVNLMVNANKYTPDGGKIKITLEVECEGASQEEVVSLAFPTLESNGENGCEAERSWLTVRIADTGPGIPQEEKSLIFDRYYRRAMHEETGMAKGLPIVRKLLELHGGKIWVESAEGKGSTFHIKLPLAQALAYEDLPLLHF